MNEEREVEFPGEEKSTTVRGETYIPTRIRMRRATQEQSEKFGKAVQKFKGAISKAYYQKASPKVRKRDASISRTVRKAVNIVAPKGSFAKRFTTQKQEGKKKYDKRGRPHGTYKTRVLPISGRPVKVPTSVYKRMASIEKKTYRLQQAQRQAQMRIQAEQTAMQQDGRYQLDMAQEQFLAEPDPEHEMQVAVAQQRSQMAQYQQPQVQQQSIGQRVISGVSSFGRGVARLGSPRQQQPQIRYDEYGRPIQVQQPQIQGGLMRSPTQGGIVREPRVTAISNKTTLLNTPNIFNRPTNPNLMRRRVL